MTGGIHRVRANMPEGVTATLVARVVDSDGSIIVDGDLYGNLHPDPGSPALNAWCLNVYDLSSDTPNRNVFVDIQSIKTDTDAYTAGTITTDNPTGGFIVGEIVTQNRASASGDASGTVRSWTAPTSDTAFDGELVVTDQTGEGIFGSQLATDLAIVGVTSAAQLDPQDTLALMRTEYYVPRCGDTDTADDSPTMGPLVVADVITLHNLYPIVALVNDGYWDLDNTGYNFKLDINPSWIEDTDDDGATVVGWRGGHTYRVECSLALGSSLATGSSTSSSGGMLPVSFEIAIDPTTSESTL